MLLRGSCCPHLQMQSVSLIIASKCRKPSGDLVSKSMLASGACARKDHEQCLSISAFGSVAGCSLPQVTQQQPELCLLESRMFMAESGFQRNIELGDAAKLARLLKAEELWSLSSEYRGQNQSDGSAAALSCPPGPFDESSLSSASWCWLASKCSFPLPESSTLKTVTKNFSFFGCSRSTLVC